MLRLIGAAMVLCGFGACGFTSARRLAMRSKNLAAIARSLSVLRSELCTRLTPLPELIGRLSFEAEEPFGAFCRNLALKLPELGETRFSELWQLAVSETKSLKLRSGEALSLTDAGRVLGRFDLDEQRETLLYIESKFRDYAENAVREYERDAKTRVAAGVSAGIIAVLILF